MFQLSHELAGTYRTSMNPDSTPLKNTLKIMEYVIVHIQRPWWPCGLSGRSNSSRVAAQDPHSNPAQGVYI